MHIRVLSTLTIGALAIGLGACSGHHNPLKQVGKQKAATFLVAASQHAEKKLHLAENSYGYRNCMNGRQKASVCDHLYSEIVRYARTQRGFENLTVSDLKDQKAWQSLKEYYQEKAFNSI